ncbi:MAG: hypothetical protein ACP5MB_06405 [bacterium]
MSDLKPRHFLEGIPSGIIYGILGVVASGLAVTYGFIDIPTGLLSKGAIVAATGGVLFTAEWIRKALEKSDDEEEVSK